MSELLPITADITQELTQTIVPDVTPPPPETAPVDSILVLTNDWLKANNIDYVRYTL